MFEECAKDTQATWNLSGNSNSMWSVSPNDLLVWPIIYIVSLMFPYTGTWWYNMQQDSIVNLMNKSLYLYWKSNFYNALSVLVKVYTCFWCFLNYFLLWPQWKCLHVKVHVLRKVENKREAVLSYNRSKMKKV